MYKPADFVGFYIAKKIFMGFVSIKKASRII
jgi:hypothetical protein